MSNFKKIIDFRGVLELFLRQNLVLKLVFTTFLFIIPLIPSGIVGGVNWDNLKFIILAFIPIIFFCYLLIFPNDISIKIIPSDLAWLLFITIGFLSFFWSTNGSLVWYQAFGWTSLIFWMIIIRSLFPDSSKKKLLSSILLAFCLLMLTYVFLILITGQLYLPIRWNVFFGYDSNKNYTSSYISCLYPFLLFYNFKYKVFNCLKVIGTLIVVYLIFLANARSALIGLILVFAFYLFTEVSRRVLLQWLTFLGGGIVLFIGAYFFWPNALDNLPFFNEINRKEGTRLFMIQNSIWLFFEYPLLGIGLGNWHVEAYKYDLSNIEPFNYPMNYEYYRNHNFYSQLLAELGGIFFFAFYYPIGKCLYKGWTKCKEITYLQRAALAAIMVYLVASFFYCTANFFEYRFSGLQFIAFVSLGILTSKEKEIYTPKVLKYFLLLIAIISFIWFIYAKVSYDKFQALNILADDKLEEKQMLLDDLYDPIFKVSHDYQTLLPFLLAKNYEARALTKEAEYYYKIAIEKSPYDKKLLLAYSKFLIREMNSIAEAKKNLEKLHGIQKNLYDANILLAEIAVIEREYKKARKHLDKIYHGWYAYRTLILEEQIYYSQYLNELMGLSSKQKTDLLILEKKYIRGVTKTSEIIRKLEAVDNRQLVKKEILVLRKEIANKAKIQEKELFKLLTEEQFALYLNNRWKNRFNYLLSGLSHKLNLTEAQRIAIFPLITAFEVEKKINDIKLHLPEVRKDKKQLIDLTIERDNLPFSLIVGLAGELTEDQLYIYIKSKVKERIEPKLNQFKNMDLEIVESKLSFIEKSLYKYEISKNLIGIRAIKNDILENQEIARIQSEFNQSVKKTLQGKALLEFQKIFEMN